MRTPAATPTMATIQCGRLSMTGPLPRHSSDGRPMVHGGCWLVDVSASPLPPELAPRPGRRLHTATVARDVEPEPDDWLLVTRQPDALPVAVRPGCEPPGSFRLGVVLGWWEQHGRP